MAKKKTGKKAQAKKSARSKKSEYSPQQQNSGSSSGQQGSSRLQKNKGHSRGQKSQGTPMIVNANNASSMIDSTKLLKQGEDVQNVLQKDDLTAKQDIFCREYLVDLNATQAAIRAGYSKETAQQMGSENLSKPVIQRRISSYMRERISRIDITQEMVIRELCKIAFANIKEFLHLDEEGNTRFIDFDEVDSDKATAISEVTVMYTQTGNKKTKLKMHDKMEALKLIGQHLGMFKIGIDANVKQLPGEYDLSKFSTDQLKTFMELTRILSETQGK